MIKYDWLAEVSTLMWLVERRCDFSTNRTARSAIRAEIALLWTNQIAGNTIDFKMNIINIYIEFTELNQWAERHLDFGGVRMDDQIYDVFWRHRNFTVKNNILQIAIWLSEYPGEPREHHHGQIWQFVNTLHVRIVSSQMDSGCLSKYFSR